MSSGLLKPLPPLATVTPITVNCWPLMRMNCPTGSVPVAMRSLTAVGPRTATFEREQSLYASQGFDYTEHLAGELDRIRDYPARGWIVAEPLPPPIAAAHAVLRAQG